MDYTAESQQLKQQLKQKLFHEVKRLLDLGHSYNEIAKELNITPQYVYLINKELKGGESK